MKKKEFDGELAALFLYLHKTFEIMDERYEYLDKLRMQLHFEFADLQRIIRYLNREINVEELPDHIRNREDAYNAVVNWNKKVNEAIELQNKYQKEGLNIAINLLERFLVKFE